MAVKTDLTELIQRMTPKLNSGTYVFVSVKDLNQIDRNDTLCEFKENDGTTVVLEKGKADLLKLNYNLVLSWISLMVHSSLEAVGFTAAVAGELQKYNISCNVIAGYHHDHIFIPVDTAETAMTVLTNLSKRHS